MFQGKIHYSYKNLCTVSVARHFLGVDLAKTSCER